MPTKLSPRQREILDRVATGRTSKEIATELGIAESTVNWHLANAFERLGAGSRAEAVALAMTRDDLSNGRPHEPTAQIQRRRRRWAMPAVFVAVAILAMVLGGILAAAALRASVPLPFIAPATPAPTDGSAQASDPPTVEPSSHVEIVVPAAPDTPVPQAPVTPAAAPVQTIAPLAPATAAGPLATPAIQLPAPSAVAPALPVTLTPPPLPLPSLPIKP